MLHQFLKDEKGQTTVEYMLIIAVIVVVVMGFGSVAQKKIKEITETVFSQVNAKIKGIFNAAQM